MFYNIYTVKGNVFLLPKNVYRELRSLPCNKAILIGNFIAFYSAKSVWVFLIIPFKLFLVDNTWGNVVSLCSTINHSGKSSSINSNRYFKV